MYEDEIFEEEQQIAEERAASLGTAILTKPIGALNLRPPIVVGPDTSVAEAVRKMVDQGVGCVLVEVAGKLVGIFTERDVLRKVVPMKIDPERAPVQSLMTPDPETLSPDARIAYALNKMSVGGFRHIPLVNAQNEPVGVVGMRDIVHYMVDLFPHEILNLPPEPGLNIARTREGA